MTKPGPGKFEGNDSLEISEFLYSIDPCDELGEVEGFGYYALIDELDTMFDRIRSGLDELIGLHLFDAEGSFIDDIKPAYIVNEDNNGFFTYTGYASNAEARKEWKKLTDEYLQFVGADDVEVSSEEV